MVALVSVGAKLRKLAELVDVVTNMKPTSMVPVILSEAATLTRNDPTNRGSKPS